MENDDTLTINFENTMMNDIKLISSDIEIDYCDTGADALIVELEKNGKRYTLLEWVENNELSEINSHLEMNQTEDLVELFGEYVKNAKGWMKENVYAWSGIFDKEAIEAVAEPFSFDMGFKLMKQEFKSCLRARS
jgi:hypothetical protein